MGNHRVTSPLVLANVGKGALGVFQAGDVDAEGVAH